MRPLMWAVLTGTFLFPFKLFLAGFVKSWLSGLHQTSTPILAGIALSPLKAVDKSLDFVGAEIVDFLRNYGIKLFYGISAIVAYFIVYFYLAPYLGFLGTILMFFFDMFNTVGTNTVRHF